MLSYVRATRVLAALAAGALLTPLAVHQAARAADETCLTEAPDRIAAAVVAARCGTPVEALSERSEQTRLFVNADGSQTVEESAHPQRVRRADGSWAALDTTLQRHQNGSVAPVATLTDLTLSGGGPGDLATVRRDGETLTLTWPGTLPRPVLSGATATYQEVIPDVDLVVTALDTGFQEVLVVKSSRAMAHKALRRVAFGLAMGGLRWERDGAGYRALGRGGKSRLTVGTPMMWDSAAGTGAPGGRARGDARGPAAGASAARMALEVTDRQVAVTPDRTFLDDPDVVYPVYLDPTIAYSAWAMINNAAPSQEYWSYDKTDCPPDPQTGSDYVTECAKVGQAPGYSGVYRSMFRFSTAGILDKQVITARFTIDLLHSADCGNTVTELRETGAISSATNWSNHASTWSGTVAATVSNQSCNQARKPSELEGANLLNRLRAIATGSATTMTWGLRAANESTTTGWKKFDAKTAKLVVTTNTPPAAATQLTADNKACVTGAARPFIKTSTPTLRARVQDADGNSLTARFEWARVRHTGAYAPVSAPMSQTSVPSGTVAQVTLPAGLLDRTDEPVAAGDWDSDGLPDVIVRDGVGDLYLFPGQPDGRPGPRSLMGVSWGSYTFAGIADWDGDGHTDIVARDGAGDLWLYPGTSSRTTHGGPRSQIGRSWGAYGLAGLADWDNDGHTDLVARDGSGVLWLYPGGSSTTGMGGPRVMIGSGGWLPYTFFGLADWDRNGNVDLIAMDGSGNKWLYPGGGVRGGYQGSPIRYQIGSGWGSLTSYVTPDVTGDGKPDTVGSIGDPPSWRVYPGSGTTTAGPPAVTVATVGISHSGRYAWRVTTADSHGSAVSGWCEFEVDTEKPATPTVTGDLYLEGPNGCPGGSCGAVGQAGRFTFSSSPDVSSYLWGFSDPPTTVLNPDSLGDSATLDWTPTGAGLHTLHVKAVDRAGNEATRAYQFFVAPPSNAVARWKLDEGAGALTLADDTGNERTMIVAGDATLGSPGRVRPGYDGATRTAMHFDGVDDAAATEAPVLGDSSRSFSVAAWVRLADNSVSRVAVSQGGGNANAFALEFHQPTGSWCLATTNADVVSPARSAACSVSPARVGTWTHLVGTYDPAAHELRLYLNGALERTVGNVTTWDADGPLRLGGGSANRWLGGLGDVQVWTRMINAAEAFELSDPIAVGRVGEYHFDVAGPGPEYDESGLAHDLTFFGGAQIPPSGAGHNGTGLRLDGVDDYAATDLPVLNTDQSFTVSAWVRPASTTGWRTFVSQQGGDAFPGFYLYYRESGGGQWVFAMRGSGTDTDTGHSTYAVAAATAITSYHHLVGVFDAQQREIRLYVDGQHRQTTPMNAAWQPWNADGPLLVGRAHHGASGTDWVQGDVDEVRLYQGAVTDVTRIP